MSQLGKIAAALNTTVAGLFAENQAPSDQPRQTEVEHSASEENSGGSHGAELEVGLLAAAREAGRVEGNTEALLRLADTIAAEIERLAGESGTTHSTTAVTVLVERVVDQLLKGA